MKNIKYNNQKEKASGGSEVLLVRCLHETRCNRAEAILGKPRRRMESKCSSVGGISTGILFSHQEVKLNIVERTRNTKIEKCIGSENKTIAEKNECMSLVFLGSLLGR